MGVIWVNVGKKLNKLRDFTLWSVSLVLRRLLRGASIRHEAFIREERLIQCFHLSGEYEAFI